MLDMSWGEVMLIGGVALIVIGPKDLPKALRTVGQITRKLRSMAGEFQMQFNEAIREADLDEARKEVDGIRKSMSGMSGSGFNPVQTIRDELKGAIESREAKAAEPAPTEPPLPAPPLADLAAAEPAVAPATRARSLADAVADLRASEAAAGGRYDVRRPPAAPPAQGA
ncbi:Sec-independent protein translocase protein TatB [Methylobacterium sp. sgz302541]|uniref:Sec-independent protein translocase protein TatB n=1 Tax=unclassified Methylobacterium TaxID=2615210 RepID=UPI003D33A72D